MDEKLKALDAEQSTLMAQIEGTNAPDQVRALQYKKLVQILLEKQEIYKQQLELLKKQIK